MSKQAIFYDIFGTNEKEWDSEQWRECGRELGRVGRTKRQEANQRQWEIGDWLLAGERHFKERKLWNEAKAITGYPRSTLKNFIWIAKVFPPSRRRDGASWSHHREVAPLSETEQDKLLDKWGKHPLKGFRAAVKRHVKDKAQAEAIRERGELIRKGEPLRNYEMENAFLSPGRRSERTSKKHYVHVGFDRNFSAALHFLFETEKQVHGQKTVEDLASWLAYQGLRSQGWLEKSKQFVKDGWKVPGGTEAAAKQAE